MAVAKCVLPLVKAPTGDWRHAGATNEHRVLRRVGEVQRAQLLDQLLIHLGCFKVKACQVTVQRELGRFHLVAHRSHGTLGVFGLQQMTDQPFARLHSGMSACALGCQLTPGPGHAVQAQLFKLGADITAHG